MPKPLPLLFAAVGLCACAAGPLRAQPAAPSAADDAELEALLNQPVYAASKFAQDAATAPAAVTVLTAGDIRAYGWRTLAEVLNGIRGVYVRYDRFYDYVGVRGFARPGDFSSRLLMLIDGMRVNDNIYDQAGTGREFPLDVALIERVEFIPGPGSALYGSNAVLGVVNIVTRSGAAMLGTTVNAELGSDASRLLGFSVGRELGGGKVLVAGKAEDRPGRTLYFPEYDDPSTNRGRSDGGDAEYDRKLYGKWTRGDLTAMGVLSERRKLIPTGAFDTVFPSRETRGTDRYLLSELQWQHDVDAAQQLFLRASLAQYEFQGRFDYGLPDGRQHLDQRGRWGGAEGRWLYAGWHGQRLVVGLEAQRNLSQRQRSSFDGAAADGDSDSDGIGADIDARSFRYGLFVNDEITLRPGLHAVLGARFDRKLSGEHAATPRLALIWEAAPGLVAKLLDGRAYREPNAYESQYHDITAEANPALRSETLHATELALDWRAMSNLRLAASAYRYRVSDLIEQQEDPASHLLMFDNVGTVRASGLELEADYVGASGWRVRGSWARQRARDQGAGQQIGNSPETLAKLHASVPLPAWDARLGFEWQQVGERLTLAGNALPAHELTNLTLQINPPGSKLAVAASVYNLFAQGYADPAGPELLQDSVPQDGRQWRVQLTLQF